MFTAWISLPLLSNPKKIQLGVGFLPYSAFIFLQLVLGTLWLSTMKGKSMKSSVKDSAMNLIAVYCKLSTGKFISHLFFSYLDLKLHSKLKWRVLLEMGKVSKEHPPQSSA